MYLISTSFVSLFVLVCVFHDIESDADAISGFPKETSRHRKIKQRNETPEIVNNDRSSI